MNNNILINQKLDVIKNLTSAKQFKQIFAKPALIEKIENMDFNQFLDFLIEKELMMVVDWSGEDNEGDLACYINQQLNFFGINFAIDNEQVQKQIATKLKKKKLQRGDYIILLIKQYQKLLSPHKMVIAEFVTYSDTYLLSITKKTYLSKLKQMQFPHDCYFRKFGERKKREILYCLHCPDPDCQSNMAGIWVLDVNDPPPSEGLCDSCGTMLFDETGKPYATMEQGFV
ncbi:DUF6630 family protein [Psychrobacter sp. I-STPA10]|uniref:DUF6630 family protein n=1 Tax=Psychrobacter sp. I-STPA10 TaxID=2585769 RepID=UPI001E472E53|nr:hypothetical protein [Psychrobacter sp. I-STPA10]